MIQLRARSTRATKRFGFLPAGLILLVTGLVLGGCSDSPTGPQVATVQVSSDTNRIRIAERVQLQAELRDAAGEPISGPQVTWSSSDETVARVSGSGEVEGIALGQVRITAEAGGASGEITLTVVESAIISSVSPAVLRPGEEAVITGANFDPSAAGNTVRVHGVQVQVLEATESSLRIRLPDLLCRPEGAAPVTVQAGRDISLPVNHPFDPGESTSLERGELRLVTSSPQFCLILDGSSSGAEYLVGVQSTSSTAATRTTVRLQGFRGNRLGGNAVVAAHDGEGAASAMVATSTFRAQAATRLHGNSDIPPSRGEREHLIHDHDHDHHAGSPDDVERWRLHRATKPALREVEARSMEPVLASPRADPRSVTLSSALSSDGIPVARVSADRQAGDTVSLRVPDINTNVCQNGFDIRAVVRRVGQHSIWVEDVNNPSGGFTTSDFDRLSDEFDSRIYSELSDHFGTPTDVDGNGRIVIVVSRKVNEMSANTLGFVVSSDFFGNQCPGANGGEFYYAKAPDPEGEIRDNENRTREYTRETARRDAPVLLAHETTHIIQFGRRFQLGDAQGSQAIWLLEGQATLAEEVVGHSYTGNAPRRNLGGGVALASNLSPTNNSWYLNAFVDLAVFYGFAGREGNEAGGTPLPQRPGAPEGCGWLATDNPDPCISGRIAYGVTWSFLRWLSDHFADQVGGERELQRRIIQSPRSGFATLQEALGQDVRPLMAYWAASLYTDGRLTGGDPLLRFPSWDLRGVEDRLIEEARLTPPRNDFVSFERETTVAAGSTLYHVVGGLSGHEPYAVVARSGTDGNLPGFMQFWVVRIR